MFACRATRPVFMRPDPDGRLGLPHLTGQALKQGRSSFFAAASRINASWHLFSHSRCDPGACSARGVLFCCSAVLLFSSVWGHLAGGDGLSLWAGPVSTLPH